MNTKRISFSTARVFSKSLFKVIESRYLSKKRWSEILSDLKNTDLKLIPLFVVGDVVILKAENHEKELLIMSATMIDLMLDALGRGENIQPIISGAVHEHHQSLLFILYSWRRSDEKRQKIIERQFAAYIKQWSEQQKKEAVRWANASLQKGKAKSFFLKILRSKK
jgi:hypothetical protein